MYARLVLVGVVAAALIGNAAADSGTSTWVVLKISRIQVKPKKIDGATWDLPSEKRPNDCGIVGLAGSAVGGPAGGAFATFFCSQSGQSQQQRDPRAPELFVQVVAGDARYRTPIALDTFAEAFDFSVIVPLDGIPAVGLEVQVLDQDADVGAGELVGMVRVTRKQVQDALAASSPLLTLSDSQVEKIELELSPYTTAQIAMPTKFEVNLEPVALPIRARAGELVTISARGKYSVASDNRQIDENGYKGGEKRGYNRKPDFEKANHAAAIAFVGAPSESHTALVVGSCVTAVTPTAGKVYVGVNDGSVTNNQGSITFAVKIAPPTLEQWRSGGVFACPEPTFGDPNDSKPDVDPRLPDSIDRAMISEAVANVKADIVACGVRSATRGQVKVAVTVGSGGRVSSVFVKSAPDSVLGECVSAAMQNATFPKTKSGGSFTYPVVF
jgi:hypothetical protein